MIVVINLLELSLRDCIASVQLKGNEILSKSEAESKAFIEKLLEQKRIGSDTIPNDDVLLLSLAVTTKSKDWRLRNDFSSYLAMLIGRKLLSSTYEDVRKAASQWKINAKITGLAFRMPMFDYIRAIANVNDDRFLPANQQLAQGEVCMAKEQFVSLLEVINKNKIAQEILELSGTVPDLPVIDRMIKGVKLPEKTLLRGAFVPEAFCPCVKSIINGVQVGARNLAIVLILAPFLTKIYFNPRRDDKNAKISNYTKDMQAINNEIMPVIMTASKASRFLDDQPTQIQAIYHVMGFGSISQPKLSDSGRSPWRTPINCSRIISAGLCRADSICKKDSNPLANYYRRLRTITKCPARKPRALALG